MAFRVDGSDFGCCYILIITINAFYVIMGISVMHETQNQRSCFSPICAYILTVNMNGAPYFSRTPCLGVSMHKTRIISEQK